MIYRGEYTNEISFPLGGIGTGCIGLAGNGRLIDWEIFNKPNKGSFNGMSHFAVKAETDEKVIDARVMNGDLHGPHMGTYSSQHYNSYGFGPDRNNLTGVPHFRDVEFVGEFPLAELRFLDDSFPGKVGMRAFNPFIPLNDKDSTIPAAFFEATVANTTNQKLNYTVCMSLNNPLYQSGAINQYALREGTHAVTLKSGSLKRHETAYGDLTIATDAEDTSYQEYWYRGGWFDNLGVFWRNFNEPGKLKNRSYPYVDGQKPEDIRHNADVCSLAAHFALLPGESKSVRFIVSWSFPNAYNYWNTESCGPDCACHSEVKTWKNYYAVLFKDSAESALYGLKNWARLYDETKRFKDALFSSSLPEAALDAVSANISLLKSPTCLRLENGEFYGWEGCHCDSGCCEGSCTHVWNYAYALPFLFPSLERSMRDLDYEYNFRDNGSMPFRLQLPLGSEMSGFRACVDGQYGNIIKIYRDWKISGDTNWLKSKWSKIKKAIAFAWSDENEDQWDRDKDGVMEGRQHHTLDMELFGPSSWLNGFYMAALKAGAEMAEALGEPDVAAEYRQIFQSGKEYADNQLFNGEYFIQKIDLNDRSLVERFNEGDALTGLTTREAYWNDEAKEIKYQIGEGSAADQLLGQWHANISGLGEIFDNEKTKTALRSIMKYNFKESLRYVFNPCRIYGLNDEAGTVICDWPEGVRKPVTPAPYCEEVWPGIEYQVGSHMIQEGLIEEGMKVITALRNRFDGKARNPWNEFECGSNYARSMASYALLNAFSGFAFDMTREMIGFAPAQKDSDGQFFFSLHSGWGQLCKQGDDWRIELLHGRLAVSHVYLPDAKAVGSVKLDGEAVPFVFEGGTVTLGRSVTIPTGGCLEIRPA